MSLTKEAVQWHEKYESLDDRARDAIDNAYAACRKELEAIRPGGMAVDDRAEELVAAITKYYYESGGR